MSRYVIVPIVEGRGEVDSVPILLRAWLRFRKYRNVEIHSGGPVYAGGKGNLAAPYAADTGRGVEHFVRVAMLRDPEPDAILILLDGDDDCPRVLSPALLARAQNMVADDFPIGVVVAHREYEAWFLAAFASSRFRRALEQRGFRLRRRALPRDLDVEGIADCKGRLDTLIDFTVGDAAARQATGYRPTRHQAQLTAILPFSPGMTRRSRSFRKLLKELHQLLKQARRRRNHGRIDRS